MATRDDIVRIALSQNGVHDGLGYDEINPYAQYFGIDYPIAYCDIFVAWVYAQAGLPLPDMHGNGVPIASGAQYCPDSWDYAVFHGATVNSWQAQPGDQVIFNWLGDGEPLGGQSHTELVQFYDQSTGWLYTIGGNSGPSNVDGFRGDGGVHRHAWYCPAGIGNSLIEGVIDTSKFVTFNTEEFVLDAEAKAAFADLKQTMQQLVTVVEGGLDPAKNPFGLQGIKDVEAKQVATDAKVSNIEALLTKLAQHQGVQV